MVDRRRLSALLRGSPPALVFTRGLMRRRLRLHERDHDRRYPSHNFRRPPLRLPGDRRFPARRDRPGFLHSDPAGLRRPDMARRCGQSGGRGAQRPQSDRHLHFAHTPSAQRHTRADPRRRSGAAARRRRHRPDRQRLPGARAERRQRARDGQRLICRRLGRNGAMADKSRRIAGQCRSGGRFRSPPGTELS